MSLIGQSFEQLEETLVADGLSRAHGLPLFKALHQDLESAPEERESLSPPLRRWLRNRGGAPGCAPRLSEETASEDGWTRKYLLELKGQTEVEVVLMGFRGRFTACISTQEGCAMGCVFCATGQMGFRRHLSVEEIVAQVHYVEREVRRRHDDRHGQLRERRRRRQDLSRWPRPAPSRAVAVRGSVRLRVRPALGVRARRWRPPSPGISES